MVMKRTKTPHRIAPTGSQAWSVYICSVYLGVRQLVLIRWCRNALLALAPAR